MTDTKTSVTAAGIKTSAHFELILNRLINSGLSEAGHKATRIHLSGAGIRENKPEGGFASHTKHVDVVVDGIRMNLEMKCRDPHVYGFVDRAPKMNKVFSDTMKYLVLEVITENLDHISDRLELTKMGEPS